MYTHIPEVRIVLRFVYWLMKGRGDFESFGKIRINFLTQNRLPFFQALERNTFVVSQFCHIWTTNIGGHLLLHKSIWWLANVENPKGNIVN